MFLVARLARGLVFKIAWWGNTNSMNATVTRKRKTTDGIFGALTMDRSLFTCFTVENLLDAIKAGVYRVTFEYSHHFNRIMPHIWDLDRDAAAQARGQSDAGLLIHWANFPTQLLGCIALGDKEEPDAIDNSRITFNKFYAIVSPYNEFTLTIVDAFA